MNKEIQGIAGSVVLDQTTGTGPWSLGGRAIQSETSDYGGEDCGCRGYRRGHSFEFQQILSVLAEGC